MELKTELEELSGVRRRLTIEIQAKDADEEYRAVAAGFHRQARLPGFRPGKAPIHLVKRYYAADIRKEVISRLVGKTFNEATKELGVSPLDDPQMVKLEYEPGQPLKHVTEFEVEPRFEMGKYKGLEITAALITVKEEDVDRQLQELQKRHATLEPVEDRPIREGDYAVIDLVGVELGADGQAGKPIVNQENLVVAVGEERTHPAFSEALLDMNIAEGKEFEISYQPDYPDKELAGKRVRFSLEVTDIKTRVLPELNDDFARDVGDHAGLDELKEDIRRHLGEHAARLQDEGARKQALQQLVELTPIEAPETLVQREIDRRIQDYAMHLQSQGVDPLRSSVNWSDLRQRLRGGAESEVQARLLLRKIAEVEGLQVGSDELEAEMAKMAESTKQPIEKISQRFADPARQEGLREHLMREKAVKLVLEEARVDFVESPESGVE